MSGCKRPGNVWAARLVSVIGSVNLQQAMGCFRLLARPNSCTAQHSTAQHWR
jgi:hypothetical protein